MIGPLEGLLVRPAVRELLLDDPVALLLEHIGASLQEQDAEDVFLELRRIHFAAKDVGCGEEVALKFLECKFGH